MQRLIDADALKTALYYDVSKGTYGEFMDGSEVSLTDREILQLIDEQPTIDAVPIEWIEMRIRGLRGQLVNADADDKDLIWDLRTKIDELGGIAEYWRKEYETD